MSEQTISPTPEPHSAGTSVVVVPHATSQTPATQKAGVSSSSDHAPLSAADYAAAADNANWRQGNLTQRRILVACTFITAVGNMMLWLVADFIGSTAPMFTASLLAVILFTASTSSCIYRGTLRSLGTLILHNSLHFNICDVNRYLNLGTSTLVSSTDSTITAEASQVRLINAGAVIGLIGSILALIAVYAEPGRITMATVTAGFHNANGVIGAITGLFLAIGSFILWALKDSCAMIPNVNVTGPLITFVVLIFSLLSNDFEARDLSFVYLVLGLVRFSPIFSDISTALQSDANSVYRAGVSIVFIGIILYTLGTLAVSIKRRPPRLIAAAENIPFLCGLVLNLAMAVVGAIMAFSKTSSTPEPLATQENYTAGLCVVISFLALVGAGATLPGVELFNLVLAPGIIAFTYPVIFSVSGTERVSDMFMTISVLTAVYLPMVNRLMLAPTNERTNLVTDKSYPYFSVGIALVIGAWLCLTETDQTTLSRTAAKAKLQLTSQTGYIGFLIIMSYAVKSEDGLKMAFYLVGNIFVAAWPWGLGYAGIQSASTIITFFALVLFLFKYLVDLGDGAFLALTVPGEASPFTPVQGAGGDGNGVYQGEEYRPSPRGKPVSRTVSDGTDNDGSELTAPSGASATAPSKSEEEDLEKPLIELTAAQPTNWEQHEETETSTVTKRKAKKN